MRKWWLAALFAVVLIPSTVSAQAAVALRAGQRSSQISTSQDGGSLNSFAIGGYFGFGLTNRLALQIEVIYGSRGGDALAVGADGLSNAATPATVDMKYVDIPILLRTGFPGERFLPSFFVGPYVGVLVNCTLTPSGQDGRDCDEEGAAQRFSPRSTDFGLMLGAGLDMAFGRNTIFLDGRYSLGLMSLESGEDPFDARHTGFALTAGFAVPLGR